MAEPLDIKKRKPLLLTHILQRSQLVGPLMVQTCSRVCQGELLSRCMRTSPHGEMTLMLRLELGYEEECFLCGKVATKGLFLILTNNGYNINRALKYIYTVYIYSIYIRLVQQDIKEIEQ